MLTRISSQNLEPLRDKNLSLVKRKSMFSCVGASMSRNAILASETGKGFKAFFLAAE